MINETETAIILSGIPEMPYNFGSPGDLGDFSSLEFLGFSSQHINEEKFVKYYAPLEPYTILPLSFKTKLEICEIANIIDNCLNNILNLTFENDYSESVWYFEYSDELTQINVYRGKNNSYHIVEFQRCKNCDSFVIMPIYNKIKFEIEKYEKMFDKIEKNLVETLELDL